MPLANAKTQPLSIDNKKKTVESSQKIKTQGLKIKRYFTEQGKEVFNETPFTFKKSTINTPDGSVLFQMDKLEVPSSWSQLATDILASKYIRKAGVPHTTHEISLKQVVHRLVRTIRKSGEEQGYFSDPENAQAFEDELKFLLTNQFGAFNSPTWFNLGLYHEYGIEGGTGNWAWDKTNNDYQELTNNYERPQCSACFIQSVDDDLSGIFKLAEQEARLFKYGSGTGTNFSALRSKFEQLSGGGTSSGLISFLEVLDRGAGATKSGGTTRRAAKMVCLDMDHPEIIDFIEWKVKEEIKALALIAAGYESDFNGEAYHTVAGQNSNNSIRINDQFMEKYETDGDWDTTFRTTGEVHQRYKAKDLFKKITQAAWSCADPGVQFNTTINHWHTCPNTAPINASNPCSEFMFLDDSACNLASLNLMKFWDDQKGFDIDSYRAAIRTFIIAQEILVDLGSYPTKKIATNSHEYRPLGLGFANLGTLLMAQGIPYDSEKGRAFAAGVTAILTGHAYQTSAEISSIQGPFDGFKKNQKPMLKVINQHKELIQNISQKHCPVELIQAAREAWEGALKKGEQYGYRNAQVTVLAPTGTIGLLMDCDTTGVEPDFSLTKWKKLAGGGYLRIVNHSLSRALKNLQYSSEEIEAIITYILGTGTFLDNETILSVKSLEKLGFSLTEIDEAKTFLKQFGQLTDFTPHINPATLREKGVEEKELQAALLLINGTGTIENAPFLKKEHYAIFDCANKCGEGSRYLAPEAHIKMMAAVQPFISGAISKTVNLPKETKVEEIEKLYYSAWKLGLKSVAIYRDQSKGSQPLSFKTESNNTKEKNIEIPKYLWGKRRNLPKRRSGFTLESTVAGHKLFLRTGEYEDGTLGEIFIDMYKEGASYRSMMNCFAIAVSIGLSYGVPLEKYVNAFTFTRFEPYGMTDHPNIKTATSLLDLIFRVLGMEYLGRRDFLHVQPEEDNKVLDITDSKTKTAIVVSEDKKQTHEIEKNPLSQQNEDLANMMGDAPACDSCGHITIRNGSCYRCLNCGNSMGCS